MHPARSALLWLPLLVAVLLIYLPGLDNQLVFDDEYLAGGKLLSDYATVTEFRPRMLSYGSFVWVRDALGEGWRAQRLLNLALHMGVVVALWGLYRELLARLEPSAHVVDVTPERDSATLVIAIGFFALNPVSVYAVAYLIQRSILMATLFVVLGLWMFVRAIARRRPSLFATALVFYALAIASKEHALLAPLAAVPLYVVAARPSPLKVAGLLAAGIVGVAAAAYALWSRYGEIIGKPFDEMSHVYLAQLGALDPGAPGRAYGLSILNQAWLFFHYGLRWMLPAADWMSINLRPPFPLTWLSWPHVLGVVGYVAVLAGGSTLVLRFRDWRALLGVSLLVPALLFASEFVTVWVQDPFVLYRSYLWAIGVPGILYIALHGLSGRALMVAATVAGTLLVWQSLDRVFSLATPERAWSDAIAKLPRDPRSVGRWFPYLNRGAARVDGRQYNLAMHDFEASSKLGDMGLGMFNRGSLYAANGEHAAALASFEAAEKQGYSLYNLPFQRGLSLQATGRPLKAYEQFVRAREMNPPSPTLELVQLHLGRAALQVGKPVEAVASLTPLVARQPRNADARFYLGMALVSTRDYARALEVLEGLPAESGRARYARALAQFGLGRRDAAISEIDAALRIGPDSAHLREWQARIKAMK